MAAHVLEFNYGSTTVPLYRAASTNPQLLRLTIGAAPISAEDVQRMLEAGDADALDQVTTDTKIELLLDAATSSALVTQLITIERAIIEAGMSRFSRRRKGNLLYLSLQKDGSGTVYRTPVFAVEHDLDSVALGVGWQARKVRLTITVEHAYYWESESGAILVAGESIWNPNSWYQASTISFNEDAGTYHILDSAAGFAMFEAGDVIHVLGSGQDGAYTVETATAGDLTVTEVVVDEAAGAAITIVGPHRNYVQIAAADVDGVYPVPCIFRLENDFNDTDETTDVVAGVNAFSDPENLDFLLEAENANTIAGGAPHTDDIHSSGGAYQRASIVGDTEQVLFQWNLSTGFLNQAKSHRFHLFVRFPEGVTIPAAYLRAAAMYPIASPTLELQSTGIVLLNTSKQLQSLGVLSLPPWLYRNQSFEEICIVLYGRKTGGMDLDLDFLALFPTDSFLWVEPATGGTEYEEIVESNSETWDLFHKTAPGAVAATYVVKRGTGMLWLYPGRINRIYVLVDAANSAQEIRRKSLITIQCHPRYATLGE